MAASRRPARRPGRRPARRRSGGPGPLLAAGVLLLLLIAAVRVVAAHPVAATLTGLGGVGAVVAAIVVRGRQQAARQAVETVRISHIGAYHRMTPREFEHALAALCRRDGCTDVRVVGGAGDLAADVIATAPDGRRIVIQAKRFGPSSSVGSGDVQKVNGTYAAIHGGQLAAIVTTSRFTRPAAELAARVGIRAYDQQALAGWASGTGPAPWDRF
ncbi:restriction endonuclease [Kitasatospora sp. NBC_01266]|uniref:restriction endonuclease n=1 Tax=Kitasatospora sp. NBC_01266 TaxID=2903572 RepID=UPI002E34F49E|nr:restriction endonuclease [Kitasatospora sp. NBC_01266]